MNSGENQAPLVVRQYVYQHYLMLLEGSTEPMVICRGANIDFVNSAAARLMGASDRNRLIEHALLDFVTPAFHAPVERYLAEAMAGNGDNGPLEVELRRIDGSMFSARLRRSYLALDGNPAVQLSVSDVSERVASERRQEHLRLALEASEVGWWDWSIASGAIYLDRSAARMLQLSEDELNTTVELCTSFVHPDDAARLFPAAEADALREDQPWHAEFRVLHAGSVTWSGIRGRVVERDREGAALRMAGTLQPMSERRESARRLALLSQYDGLTGLPNRVLFRDRLSLAISRAKRNQALVGVVFLNLDRFARINDTLGPATGDRLLQEIAIRLRHNMREADTIGRLGGDEFTLIVEQAEEPLQLERVAEKIRGALSAPLLVAGQEIYLNASIGLSIYPRDSEDAEQLLKNADIAMYRAKSHGGNAHLFYSPEMATTSVQRLSLEAELRRALEREEFVLHYQPIFDVVSGAVLGAEALVRWQSPKGMIGPNEFISIAEETGLIFELGAWVLLTACTQAIEWQQAGLPLRIAVNLSPRQFLQPDLLQIVAGALDKTGLPPQLLALEITEGMLMHQHESIPNTLSCLNRLGIRIAIDDFGTGYSSLSYLKRFQVQELKIDRSFVRGLPGNADDAAIVTAIASMAKSLGMRLIAEGVESEAQLSFVTRLGCDAVQGFLLGKPAHAEEFARRFIDARATSMITSADFR
jgi:diguanylate cyclase (GGDEF)-like protein/PAS domain S-box-containing protein